MSTIKSLPTVTRAWWREPYVWLIISGPLAVVVAGLVTAAIAIKYQDPVLDAQSPRIQRSDTDNKSLTLAPAQQARNHAATATLPEKR
ncbi:nitrogen fixation protein FixH [Hydrogenophaga sp. OTU3427]|uniref:nitrogen fixation protein FixH n=1 Tax=Hydrogenophaga sp. OTU3427 TaxID=3043856 RepID=UPI00313CCE70